MHVRPSIDVRKNISALLSRQPPLVDIPVEPLANRLDPFANAPLINIIEEHVMPFGSKHLRNPTTHLPSTNDQYAHSDLRLSPAEFVHYPAPRTERAKGAAGAFVTG